MDRGQARASPPWVPLVVSGIGAATLFPFELDRCGPQGWAVDIVPLDVVQNVLLFVPLGLALRRRSIGWAIGVVAALSLGVETLQVWLPRNPNLTDVVSNTAGGVLGWTAIQRWGPEGERLRRLPVLRFLALGLVGLALALSMARTRRSDFSNWEPASLVLANEARGSRPWVGTVQALAIYDRPDAEPVRDPIRDGWAPPSWKDGGPVLWLRLIPPMQGWLDGPDGRSPLSLDLAPKPTLELGPHGLVTHAPRFVLPQAASDHVLRRLKLTSRMAVALVVLPADATGYGPARLVTFSRDTGRTNFLLGQSKSEVTLRIRTPAVGPGGDEIVSKGAGLGTRDAPFSILATYDGHRAHLEADGRCVADVSPGLLAAPIPVGRGLGLTIVVTVALGALSGASLGRMLSGPRGPSLSARLGAAAAGGLVVWSAMAAGPIWTVVPGFTGRAALLGLVTLATTLYGIRWGDG